MDKLQFNVKLLFKDKKRNHVCNTLVLHFCLLFLCVCVFILVSILVDEFFKSTFILEAESKLNSAALLPTAKQIADKKVFCMGFPSLFT